MPSDIGAHFLWGRLYPVPVILMHYNKYMHTIHFIALELPANLSTAPSGIGSAIDGLVSDAIGAPSWWDWYEVGGRWDGELAKEFPDAALVAPNVVSLSKNPQVAQKLLEQAQKRQNSVFLHMRDLIVGNEVLPAELPGHVFGIPVAQDQEQADRITQHNREQAQAWQDILASPSLKEIPQNEATYMAPYYVRKLIDVIEHRWNEDSGFFDAINGTPDPQFLLDATAAFHAGASPEVVLVAVDFHY